MFHEGFDFILGDFEAFQVLNLVFVDGPKDFRGNGDEGVDMPPCQF